LEYTRMGGVFHHLLESMDVPGKLMRVSSPTGYDPFLCETIVDYLYWKARGKRRLWVFPLACEDPEISTKKFYQQSLLNVLRQNVIYVGSDIRPSLDQRGAYSGKSPIDWGQEHWPNFMAFSYTGIFSIDIHVAGFYRSASYFVGRALVVKDEDQLLNQFPLYFSLPKEQGIVLSGKVSMRCGPHHLIWTRNDEGIALPPLLFAVAKWGWDIRVPKKVVRAFFEVVGCGYPLGLSNSWLAGEWEFISMIFTRDQPRFECRMHDYGSLIGLV